MIKGMILDIDGVVLDSMSIWQDLGKRYIKNKGKTPEENLSEILFSMSMEQGADYMKERYQLSETPETIVEELGNMIERFYFYEVETKNGIKELMDYCKDHDIAMIAATSSMRELVTRALIRNGLNGYVKEILTSAEIGCSKHEPLIYEIAAEKMGTKAEETLVLEDSLYALETAKTAGFIPIGVYDSYGEANQESLAVTGKIYVRDLKEVIPFIISENEYI
ncbi:MAG: HAD family phosphatase [Eubacteriales bacterium]|nr:HAD family phosphatase [Eubacteriales bacterium]